MNNIVLNGDIVKDVKILQLSVMQNKTTTVNPQMKSHKESAINMKIVN